MKQLDQGQNELTTLNEEFDADPEIGDDIISMLNLLKYSVKHQLQWIKILISNQRKSTK